MKKILYCFLLVVVLSLFSGCDLEYVIDINEDNTLNLETSFTQSGLEMINDDGRYDLPMDRAINKYDFTRYLRQAQEVEGDIRPIDIEVLIFEASEKNDDIYYNTTLKINGENSLESYIENYSIGYYIGSGEAFVSYQDGALVTEMLGQPDVIFLDNTGNILNQDRINEYFNTSDFGTKKVLLLNDLSGYPVPITFNFPGEIDLVLNYKYFSEAFDQISKEIGRNIEFKISKSTISTIDGFLLVFYNFADSQSSKNSGLVVSDETKIGSKHTNIIIWVIILLVMISAAIIIGVLIKNNKAINKSYCPYCGHTLINNAKFCGKCGKEIK